MGQGFSLSAGCFRPGRIRTSLLAGVGIIAVVLTLGAEYLRLPGGDPLLQEKRTAAKLMAQALAAIKEKRLAMGLSIDPKTDPNGTGLIGIEFNDLTTTVGSLSAKRTSTNPNFAGLIVEMLSQAKVGRGEAVAVSFSGSFPALNIAVLAALHVLEIRPVIISSVGASMYGANHPQLTWLDMERILREANLLPYRSEAASLGGIRETEGGLDGTGIVAGLEAIRRNQIPYLDEGWPGGLDEEIERRLKVYQRGLGGLRPAAFINVGGSMTSFGSAPEAAHIGFGLLAQVPSSNHPQRGLIFRMAEQGAQVISFLNINRIALAYGLPVDPIPLPPPVGVDTAKALRGRLINAALALAGLYSLCLMIYGLNRIRSGRRDRGQPVY